MSEIEEVYLTEFLKSLKGLKSTVEKALVQINDSDFHFLPDPESNSIAIIIQHLSGNMLSRFSDFLTTDGEKVWRKRDDEFVDEILSRNELMNIWNIGWDCVFNALNNLTTDDLLKIIYIRKEEHTILRAMQRQLVHYAYHAGQIVYICKQIRSSDFQTLSIPRKK